MRAPWLALFTLVCLLLAGGPLVADEPPAEPSAEGEAVPGEGTDAEPGGEEPAEEETAPPLTPSAAWKKVNEEVRELPSAQRRRELAARSRSFLEEWAKRGEVCTGEDLYHLGMFHRTVVKYDEALTAFAAAAVDPEAPVAIRDLSAVAESTLLLNRKVQSDRDPAELEAARERLLAYAGAMTGPHRKGARTVLRVNLALLLDGADQKDASLEMLLRAALDDPNAAGRAYRLVVRNLVGRSHEMGGYAAVRASALAAMLILEHQQQRAIEQAEARVEALRAEGNESGAASARSTAASARALLERIRSAGRPFEMLGEVAPPWTLVKAYGDVEQIEDLRGKVVVLDFWATWCGWCIRSFPALRELLRDYGDRGLVVVGVTASSRSVYEARYDLDDDVKTKGGEGWRPRPAARLASSSLPADGETVLELEAFREKEREVIAKFIENHEMTWPVVMIDATEPGPKYALTGWPHAVVLDRQGRVRYFKSGALLHDRPKGLAAFRKVLEDLLEE